MSAELIILISGFGLGVGYTCAAFGSKKIRDWFYGKDDKNGK